MKDDRGFSLLEVMASITISSIVIVLLVTLVLWMDSLTQTFHRVYARSADRLGADIVLQRVAQDASSVSLVQVQPPTIAVTLQSTSLAGIAPLDSPVARAYAAGSHTIDVSLIATGGITSLGMYAASANGMPPLSDITWLTSRSDDLSQSNLSIDARGDIVCSLGGSQGPPVTDVFSLGVSP